MSNQLRWMCRRGMKELDLLMGSYLDHGYPTASPERKAAFEKLLSYQDPVILDLLMNKIQDDDAEVQALINVLQSYQLDQSEA